jgi:tetratricopeptide (TPR) repeat protein
VQHEPVEQVLELMSDGHSAAALAVLDALLREEPYHGQLFALRALIRADLGRLDEAAEDACSAREFLPNHPFSHYVAGAVALQQGAMLDAIQAAQAARRIAPDYAAAVLLEARARAALGQWTTVLSLAESVTEREPEHEEAALLATIARESRSDGALDPKAWKRLVEQFPLNAIARTGSGWTRLNAGQIQVARSEFEQALALDPALPWAKAGLVLALKARNPVYALLLRFFMWFGKLPPRTRTIVLVGGVLGYNTLRRTAADQPALRPFLLPLLLVYLAFVVLSWLADPLLNLLLMAREEGRRLLSPDERRSALLVGSCLGLAGLMGVVAAGTSRTGALLSALGLGFASFAIAAAYTRRGRKRRQLQVCAAIAAGSSLAAGVVPQQLAATCFLLAILCTAASTWMSHFGSDAPTGRRGDATLP